MQNAAWVKFHKQIEGLIIPLAIFRRFSSALDLKVTAVLIDLLPRKLETVGSYIKIYNSGINQKIFMVLQKHCV